ncbi:hypothetical protein EJ02DRAFT_176647 [Clathrospora elynae]|uniref:2EXR domain-containing protein n=1 Tax=Clathrospora elynae TaxID=706981 RepID=A0A6A5SRQ8_9PLEO|nr:hypothetical protein EJ02DRAFT_176647 [Clathrospora elynae]
MDNSVSDSGAFLTHLHGGTTNKDTDCGSPFLRLPAELRNMIYEHTFNNETILVRQKDDDEEPHHPARTRTYQPIIALLFTCRQTRKESSAIFDDRVIFDLTSCYNFTMAEFDLGSDKCRVIKSIQINSRDAKRLVLRLQSEGPPRVSYHHSFPSLQCVFIRHSPIFGLLSVSHELVVRAMGIFFGNEKLGVRFIA